MPKLVVVVLVPLFVMTSLMGGMMGGGMMNGGFWLMSGFVLLVLVAGAAILATGTRR